MRESSTLFFHIWRKLEGTCYNWSKRKLVSALAPSARIGHFIPYQIKERKTNKLPTLFVGSVSKKLRVSCTMCIIKPSSAFRGAWALVANRRLGQTAGRDKRTIPVPARGRCLCGNTCRTENPKLPPGGGTQIHFAKLSSASERVDEETQAFMSAGVSTVVEELEEIIDVAHEAIVRVIKWTTRPLLDEFLSLWTACTSASVSLCNMHS